MTTRREFLGSAAAGLAAVPMTLTSVEGHSSPAVPTLDPGSALGRLAVAYGRAIDRATAAVTTPDDYQAMAEFDRAEEALFEAMQENGLRAIVVGGRLYVDQQYEEVHIPDRPQLVLFHDLTPAAIPDQPRRPGRPWGDLEAAAAALSAAVARIARMQPEYDEADLGGPEAARWEEWYRTDWYPAEAALEAANDRLCDLMGSHGLTALYAHGRLFTRGFGDVVKGLAAYPDSIGIHSLASLRLGGLPAEGGPR